jgi:hypothetical protein
VADYQVVIDRALSDLASGTPEARKALYTRARSALVTHLRAQGVTAAQIESEQRTPETAVRRGRGPSDIVGMKTDNSIGLRLTNMSQNAAGSALQSSTIFFAWLYCETTSLPDAP